MSHEVSQDAKLQPILITGGTGFAGSHLTEHLLSLGYTNIHLTTYGADTNDSMFGSEKVTLHSIDLCNTESSKKLFESIVPARVFHLASLASVGKSFKNIQSTIEKNTALQLSVLEGMSSLPKTAKMLHISSSEVYGKVAATAGPLSEDQVVAPVSPYGISKAVQEFLVQQYRLMHDLHIVIVRPFNHIGERQRKDFVVSSFAYQVAQIEKTTPTQGSMQVGNLSALRDFTDVKDMVRAYHILIERGIDGQAYNAGSGRAVSIEQILKTFIDSSKTPITPDVAKDRLRPLDIPVMIADNEKLKQLGWQPEIALPETLQRVLAFWRDHS